jgi:hypothetical protein
VWWQRRRLRETGKGKDPTQRRESPSVRDQGHSTGHLHTLMTQPFAKHGRSPKRNSPPLSLFSSLLPLSLNPSPPVHVPPPCPNASPTPSVRQRRRDGPPSRSAPSAVLPLLSAELQRPARFKRKVLQAQEKILGTRGGHSSLFFPVFFPLPQRSPDLR